MKKRSKRITALLLSVLLTLSVVLSLPVHAAAEETTPTGGTTGDCTWTLSENGVLTISGNGEMGNYSDFDEPPWDESVHSVIIEEGVTTIGDFAFSYYRNVCDVTIPDSVTSIGNCAFNRTGLTSITIPQNVTDIGIYAFARSPISSVTVDEENLEYDSRENCNAIIQSETNTVIFGCSNTHLPDDVIAIGDYAFSSCSDLTGIYIPDSVTEIGDYAFSDCSDLTNIVLPENLTSIGAYAFVSTGLRNVTVPNSTTFIGEFAFGNCDDLENIYISENVTEIGDYAFDGCDSLTIHGNLGSYAETYANENGIPFVSIGEAPQTGDFLYEVSEQNTATVTGYTGNGTEMVIPETLDGYQVTAIQEQAFMNNNQITAVTIPDSVVSIGSSAFFGCTSLKSMSMPDSVTNIGLQTFARCTVLENVRLSNSLTRIDGTFESCTALKEITLPDSITFIGQDAFRLCESLASITIPENVSVIFTNAFQNCTSLRHVNIPAKVQYIENAFSLSSVSEITVDPENTEYCSIDGNLYSKNQSDLLQYAPGKTEKSFTVPAFVSRLGSYAFAGSSSLKHVTLSNGITSVPYCAFYCCDALQTVVLPDSLQAINMYAFLNCPQLKSIAIPAATETIRQYAVGYSQTAAENEKVAGFTIYGYPNTAAETYANENGFTFINLCEIPATATGDINLDGSININDVTALQRHIAELEMLTETQLAVADTNGDGVVNIDDATHLQRYLAEFDVTLG